MSVFWIYQGYEHASGSEYARFLNKSGFWIHQGSEYSSGSEFARVLNMSELDKVLNMPEYAWLCLAEYAWICLSLLGYA